MSAPFTADGPAVRKLRRQVLSPWKLRLFLLTKLPLGLVAGLKVTELDARRCSVTVPYRWRTKNPFRSTYFAALSMAAEMSTGVLALAVVAAAPRKVSMLITGMQASFVKKATDVTTFTCVQGEELAAAVIETVETGEPVVRQVETVGTNPAGEEVARFQFTWSFKRKG